MLDKTGQKIARAIRAYMDKNRRTLSSSELYILVVYVLYGVHKQYKTAGIYDKFRFDAYSDELLQDLFRLCENSLTELDPYELYDRLNEFTHESFENCYIEVLSLLTEFEASNSGRRGGEFFSPSEINKLIAYFVNSTEVSCVYDPFCGTASLVHYLEDNIVSFEGQDIYNRTAILARVNVDARYGVDKGVSCGNSILNWNTSHFDAVVTCPPFNQGLSLSEMKATNVGDGSHTYNIEDIVFINAINHNTPRIIISLVPINFSYSLSHKWIRQYLVDKNLLDTIIYLPDNLLYGTSVPCILVICRTDRKDKTSIKIMDASSFWGGVIWGDSNRKQFLNYDPLIRAYESDNGMYCVNTTKLDIQANDYNLNLHLYNQEMIELKDGQHIHLLSALMEESKRRMATPDDNHMLFSNEFFSNNIIEVMLNKDKLIHLQDDKSATPKKLIKVSKGKKYLLYLDGYRSVPRLAIYTGQDDILCSNNVKAFEVREELVSPEYLAYLIINNPVLKKSYGSISNYMTIQVVVDSYEKQKEILSKLSQQHTARMQEEQEADAKRLGVKLNISDMEHMLGTPKMKIDNIIEDLGDFMPSQEDYQEVVRALKDNVDYMFRLIHFNNASMNTETLNITPNNLQAFLDQYAKAWSNYGGDYFALSIRNDLEPSLVLNFDKLFFTVMFDSVLSNAVRHGFKKNKTFTLDNRVEIAVSAEKYDGKPYVVFRISNNGNPMSNNFTLNDYITRGRYSATSGRSGLGGYHVYQIAKAHNGFLYLDSNKIWNLVVEVLVPVDIVESDNLIEYEHECI